MTFILSMLPSLLKRRHLLALALYIDIDIDHNVEKYIKCPGLGYFSPSFSSLIGKSLVSLACFRGIRTSIT